MFREVPPVILREPETVMQLVDQLNSETPGERAMQLRLLFTIQDCQQSRHSSATNKGKTMAISEHTEAPKNSFFFRTELLETDTFRRRQEALIWCLQYHLQDQQNH